MQIETYEIEEVKGELGNLAADSEAIELAKKLNLTGQISLSDTNTDTRFPYPQMTKEQHLIFKTLFPESSPVESFKGGIIPLRVLQVIAFCKDFPQTKYMEVWHSRLYREDPILTGREDNYRGDVYLLARWGESLLSFDALAKKAMPLIKATYTKNIKEALEKLQLRLRTIDESLPEIIHDGDIPSFYIS